jgi:hypothetical protein
MTKERRWQDGVMLVLGLWLIVSPFFLSYVDLTGMAALNSYVFGIGIAIFAIIALAKPQAWEEWVNLVLGIWLIVAPIVLGFRDETTATINHFVVGLLVGADALYAMYPRFTRKAT